MGTPAESRSLVAHLINARIPYSYETPKFLLMCEGITELTEELNPDTEEIQYICETTKTTNIKSYSKKLEVDMAYIRDNELINYANYLIRTMGTGKKASGDYVRINKDEEMYSVPNSYIAIRQRATVYPESIGGSAEDPLHEKFVMDSAGDQEIGYITISTLGSYNSYLWVKANLEIPYLTKIGNVNIEDFFKNMTIVAGGNTISFELEGKSGSTIKAYKGIGQEVSIASSSWNGDKCTCTINCSELPDGKVTLAFQQQNNTDSSVTTHPVTFNLIKGSLSAPTVTFPSDSSTTTKSSSYNFVGTANEYATVNLANAATSNTVSTIADSNGRWSSNVQLKSNSENVINVTQSISGETSASSVSKTIKCLSIPEITSPSDGDTVATANLAFTGKGLKGATLTLSKNGEPVELQSGEGTVGNDGTFTLTPKTNVEAGTHSFTIKQSLDSLESSVTLSITVTSE